MVKKLYTKIKTLYEKYERLLIPGTLVFGIIVDSVTFASIKVTSAFLILCLHILLAGGIIAFLNAYDAKLIKENKVLRYIRLVSPLIIQFSFGALLSACFIFYLFSGSIYVSWPLILLIVILLIFNDVFRKYYLRLQVQISVYFFLLLAIFAIILPYMLQRLGAWVFVLSGALSLFFIFGYITLLSRYIQPIKIKSKNLLKPIAIIFVFLNFLYFLNVIPPVPLSLKDSALGHKITRTNGKYSIMVEEESVLEKIMPGQTIHKVENEDISFYTAIFAPGSLKTKIYHHWQHKENGKWVSKSRLSFIISGGRKDGFRGYSIKRDVPEGDWRVDIETERGQVLGRVRFDVIRVSELPTLIKTIK